LLLYIRVYNACIANMGLLRHETARSGTINNCLASPATVTVRIYSSSRRCSAEFFWILATFLKNCSVIFIPFFWGGGRFFLFFSYCIQHGFICRPSDSTMPTDAGIEPRTVATGALAVRRSNH
jgi:hypothetical protein